MRVTLHHIVILLALSVAEGNPARCGCGMVVKDLLLFF